LLKAEYCIQSVLMSICVTTDKQFFFHFTPVYPALFRLWILSFSNFLTLSGQKIQAMCRGLRNVVGWLIVMQKPKWGHKNPIAGRNLKPSADKLYPSVAMGSSCLICRVAFACRKQTTLWFSARTMASKQSHVGDGSSHSGKDSMANKTKQS